MTDADVTWLTAESKQRLQDELDALIANRGEMAAEINERREEGDLKENGGYHAAREEQGQKEARIRQLQALLKNAQIGEAPTQSGVALPGTVVTIHIGDDESNTQTFLLATREESVSTDLNVFSPSSPLGTAILDAKVGESRTYRVPSGAELTVTVVSAEPYQH